MVVGKEGENGERSGCPKNPDNGARATAPTMNAVVALEDAGRIHGAVSSLGSLLSLIGGRGIAQGGQKGALVILVSMASSPPALFLVSAH